MINWGIIGCGDVTELKSGPAFKKVADSDLLAVMRRDAAKAADYASRHRVGKWYSDADKMMAEAGVNAIYIATPPSSHLEYALSALEKGFNVYVEKPVTRNADEARAMAAAVKQSNAKLTVAHYRRAVPMFLMVKDLLDKQKIGEVRTVQIRMWQSRKPKLIAESETNWRVLPEFSGGGYFHDLAPHQLDLMLYYFGEPEKYHGFSLNQSASTPADDHVCGEILFKNKVVVNGSWCFSVAESLTTDTCEIIGTKGKITFPFFGNYVTWKTDTEDETVTFKHPQHIQQPMIEKIVTYFKNEGPNPCSIDEAIVLMDIMDSFTKTK
ncbi:Gfo/Idh/MocA family protein [Mucilaginibacter ginsenosidivorax]|uniref:Gfo/Idh/MocA family oxidoreductase n=1 Tax=Mucilaginibacter ginsenosidivorax TaxID=862126 RepID=A0A5B8VWW1_9SPHI|nr:Gfo/Idh/MocA family oxidoreductase [Mucilaginibacter ginsenosidivorax]QEC75681.1 Gfo/Idh/MocA family oxidoreductase [Mucilaginibacter ginsenosidivorax]